MVIHSKKRLRVQSRNVAFRSCRKDVYEHRNQAVARTSWQDRHLQLSKMVTASKKRRGLFCVKLAMGSTIC